MFFFYSMIMRGGGIGNARTGQCCVRAQTRVFQDEGRFLVTLHCCEHAETSLITTCHKYLKLFLHQRHFRGRDLGSERAQCAVQLREGDLGLSKLVVLQQRLVDQDVLSLRDGKNAHLKK